MVVGKISRLCPLHVAGIITGCIIVARFLLSILLIGGLSNQRFGLTDKNYLPQYIGISRHSPFA